MGLITVDETKCSKDGLCAAVCPSRVILLRGKEKFPEVPRALERGCILCGHCVAVCPHGALSHQNMPLETCPPIDPALVIDEAQAAQFLRSRRSIRYFKDQPVALGTLQALIDTARYAPTASNTQRVQWLVVTDPEVIREVSALTVEYMQAMIGTGDKTKYPPYYPPMVAAYNAGSDPILRKAPALIIASTPAMRSNGMVDLSIAMTYLELMASAMGLGTCWAGIVYSSLMQHPPVRELLGLPEDQVNVYPMMLGYPKYRYHRLPERKPPQVTWR